MRIHTFLSPNLTISLWCRCLCLPPPLSFSLLFARAPSHATTTRPPQFPFHGFWPCLSLSLSIIFQLSSHMLFVGVHHCRRFSFQTFLQFLPLCVSITITPTVFLSVSITPTVCLFCVRVIFCLYLYVLGQLELKISTFFSCQKRSNRVNTNLQNKHIEWYIICYTSLPICSISGKTVRHLRSPLEV